MHVHLFEFVTNIQILQNHNILCKITRTKNYQSSIDDIRLGVSYIKRAPSNYFEKKYWITYSIFTFIS